MKDFTAKVNTFDSLESIERKHKEKLQELKIKYIQGLKERKKELEQQLQFPISDNQKQLIYGQIKDIVQSLSPAELSKA